MSAHHIAVCSSWSTCRKKTMTNWHVTERPTSHGHWRIACPRYGTREILECPSRSRDRRIVRNRCVASRPPRYVSERCVGEPRPARRRCKGGSRRNDESHRIVCRHRHHARLAGGDFAENPQGASTWMKSVPVVWVMVFRCWWRDVRLSFSGELRLSVN